MNLTESQKNFIRQFYPSFSNERKELRKEWNTLDICWNEYLYKASLILYIKSIDGGVLWEYVNKWIIKTCK